MLPSRTTFQEIVASWLSMKPWVKNWLFFLNAVFLCAFGFLSDPAARWILVGYVASGPLLMWIMVRQRGLTRLLGLAHLIPWVPLLIYLVLRLCSDLVGPLMSIETEPAFTMYLYLLLACLAFCLTLDGWDVIRYTRGERYVLGSPEAVRLRASRPSPVRLPCEA